MKVSCLHASWATPRTRCPEVGTGSSASDLRAPLPRPRPRPEQAGSRQLTSVAHPSVLSGLQRTLPWVSVSEHWCLGSTGRAAPLRRAGGKPVLPHLAPPPRAERCGLCSAVGALQPPAFVPLSANVTVPSILTPAAAAAFSGRSQAGMVLARRGPVWDKPHAENAPASRDHQGPGVRAVWFSECHFRAF